MMPRDNRIRRRGTIARRLPRPARWRGWADQLRDRHERVADRHRHLALVLLRRVAPLHVTIERRREGPQIGPRIDVAIRLFLKFESGGRFTRRDARPAPLVLSARSRGAQTTEQGRTGMPGIPDRHARIEHVTGANVPETPSDVRNQSPLLKVARRMQRAADVQETALRLMPRGGRTLLRSVVRRDRVEWPDAAQQRRGRLLQRAAAPKGAAPHLAAPYAVEKEARMQPAGAPARVAFEMAAGDPAARRAIHDTRIPTAPAINVEDLTERVVREIDRRIVAHRERHGRPF